MGVRVNPSQIETLLYELRLVSEVGVFGKKHDLLGDEIWAAVVPREGVEQVATKLTQYARKVMSDYMLPRRFLVKSVLEKTSTGKIDYQKLREDALQSPSASFTDEHEVSRPTRDLAPGKS